MLGEGPKLGLPSSRRALALAPHPDDESLGCGGTLALLSDQGSEVVVAFATDGDALEGTGLSRGEVRDRRRREAEEACRILGAKGLRFLGHRDGALSRDTQALAADLRRLISEESPDLILLPWFLDAHDDHRAINDALARCSLPESVRLWGYEVWTPLPANRFVDISDVWEKKKAAIEAHASDPLVDAHKFLGLNRYRAGQALIAGSHAEAFLASSAPHYFSLMHEVSES